MSLKENVKTKCIKCNGKGYTDIQRVKINNHKIQFDEDFQLLCMHCYGVGRLDWLEQIRGKSIGANHPVGASFYLMHWIGTQLPKANWMYNHHGTSYYIYNRFFENYEFIEDKMKNFVIKFNV